MVTDKPFLGSEARFLSSEYATAGLNVRELAPSIWLTLSSGFAERQTLLNSPSYPEYLRRVVVPKVRPYRGSCELYLVTSRY